MREEKKWSHHRGITRFSKESERFFYCFATVAMVMVYVILKIF